MVHPTPTRVAQAPVPRSVCRFASWRDWPAARYALRRRYPAPLVTHLGAAYRFAADWHRDQRRPAGQPYTDHLLETLEIVAAADTTTFGCPTLLFAALLHDVVEDSACTFDDVGTTFGPTVANYVRWLTQPDDEHDPAAGRQSYLARLSQAPDPALTVKLADRYSNVQRLHTHPRPEARRSYYAETVTWFLPVAGRIPFFTDLYATWAEAYRYLAETPEPQQ